jgi:hypothetical protein
VKTKKNFLYTNSAFWYLHLYLQRLFSSQSLRMPTQSRRHLSYVSAEMTLSAGHHGSYRLCGLVPLPAVRQTYWAAATEHQALSPSSPVSFIHPLFRLPTCGMLFAQGFLHWFEVLIRINLFTDIKVNNKIFQREMQFNLKTTLWKSVM